jgi:HEPN domain-containing protein
MDDAKKELSSSWLLKSWHDLSAARLLAKADPPILDGAIYHCQQAAEKAVKGFLLFNDQFPDKTQNVLRLVEVAITWNPSFSASLDAADRLTPYATLYRYPRRLPLLDLDQVEQALDDAEAILSQALAHPPPKVHPEAKHSESKWNQEDMT